MISELDILNCFQHLVETPIDDAQIVVGSGDDAAVIKSNIKDLSFALGKIYEDIGEYKKSFEYIKKANDIKKQLTKFDINSEIEFFMKIKNFHENTKIKNLPINENKKKIVEKEMI